MSIAGMRKLEVVSVDSRSFHSHVQQQSPHPKMGQFPYGAFKRGKPQEAFDPMIAGARALPCRAFSLSTLLQRSCPDTAWILLPLCKSRRQVSLLKNGIEHSPV
jgi:hypothetical protein